MIHLRCGDCGGKEVAIGRTYTLKQGEHAPSTIALRVTALFRKPETRLSRM